MNLELVSMDHLSLLEEPVFTPPPVPFLGLHYSVDHCVHFRLEDQTKGLFTRIRSRDKNISLCKRCRPYVNGTPMQRWQFYPARMGWDLPELLRGQSMSHVHQMNIESSDRVLQAWLYEGVLFACTSEVLSLSSEGSHPLLKEIGGAMHINTSHLCKLLDWFQTRLEANQRFNTHLLSALQASLLKYLQKIFNDHIIHNAAHPLPVPEEISCSFVVLWEALSHLHSAILRVKMETILFREPCSLLMRKLKQHKWCPRELGRLEGQELLFAACQLGERYRHNGSNHSSCSLQRCIGSAIDETTYKAKRCSDHCKCRTVFFDVDLIADYWLDDLVPLVKYDEKAGTFVPTRSNEYAAISHVWADGFGNPSENGLPECQLTEIQNAVNRAQQKSCIGDSNMPFFLDTLCIPYPNVKNPRHRFARKKAITYMGWLYTMADLTIVFDKDLYERRGRAISLENFLRISVCSWSYRVWTCQEAYNTQNLFVVFADDILNLTTEIAWFSQKSGWRLFDIRTWVFDQILEMLSLYAANSYPRLWDLGTFDMRTVSVCKSMRFRSSARINEDIVCVALASYTEKEEIGQYIECDPDRQAVQLLKRLKWVDPVVATTTGERMNQTGFYWAPQDLIEGLAASPLDVKYTMDSHKITKKGLVGVWLSFTFTILVEPIEVKPDDMRCFAVTSRHGMTHIFIEDLKSLVLDGTVGNRGDDSKATAFFREYAGMEIAFLYKDRPDFYPNPGEIRGIFAVVKGKEGQKAQDVFVGHSVDDGIEGDDKEKVPIGARRISATVMKTNINPYLLKRRTIILRGRHDRTGETAWCLE